VVPEGEAPHQTAAQFEADIRAAPEEIHVRGHLAGAVQIAFPEGRADTAHDHVVIGDDLLDVPHLGVRQLLRRRPPHPAEFGAFHPEFIADLTGFRQILTDFIRKRTQLEHASRLPSGFVPRLRAPIDLSEV